MESNKKAIVHMDALKPDLRLMLPIILSDEQAARIVIPPQSTYRMKVLGQGRITVPKSVRDALGIVAGDEVDIIVTPARDREVDE